MPPARSLTASASGAGRLGPSRHTATAAVSGSSSRRAAAVRQHHHHHHHVNAVVGHSETSAFDATIQAQAANNNINAQGITNTSQDSNESVPSSGSNGQDGNNDNDDDDNDMIDLFTDPMLGTPLSIYVEKDVEDREEVLTLIGQHGGIVSRQYSSVPYILVNPLKESGQNLYRQFANKKGKVILDSRWVHECIKHGRLQTFQTNFAGCKVTGTEMNEDRSAILSRAGGVGTPSVTQQQQEQRHQQVLEAAAAAVTVPPASHDMVDEHLQHHIPQHHQQPMVPQPTAAAPMDTTAPPSSHVSYMPQHAYPYHIYTAPAPPPPPHHHQEHQHHPHAHHQNLMPPPPPWHHPHVSPAAPTQHQPPPPPPVPAPASTHEQPQHHMIPQQQQQPRWDTAATYTHQPGVVMDHHMPSPAAAGYGFHPAAAAAHAPWMLPPAPGGYYSTPYAHHYGQEHVAPPPPPAPAPPTSHHHAVHELVSHHHQPDPYHPHPHQHHLNAAGLLGSAPEMDPTPIGLHDDEIGEDDNEDDEDTGVVGAGENRGSFSFGGVERDEEDEDEEMEDEIVDGVVQRGHGSGRAHHAMARYSPTTTASNLVANRTEARVRSPSPPRRIEKSAYGGNVYTPEDKQFLHDYIQYCQDQGLVLSLREICEKVAIKAPHHSFYSWRRYCNKHGIRVGGHAMAIERSTSPDHHDVDDEDQGIYHHHDPTLSSSSSHVIQQQLLQRPSHPPERTPSPPRSLFRSTTGKGVAFTDEDTRFLLSFMTYRRAQGQTDMVAFWKEVATKAPHHSRASWMKYWRRHKHEFERGDGDEPLPPPPEKKMRYSRRDDVLLARYFFTPRDGTIDSVFQAFARLYPHHPWKGWQEHYRLHRVKIDHLIERLNRGENIAEGIEHTFD